MPSLANLLLHARLFRPDRHARPDDNTATLGAPLHEARTHRVDGTHLNAFRCLVPGWPHDYLLPPSYPQVVAADLHLRMLGDRRFPFQPMGLVHVSNRIDYLAPLHVDADYQLSATLASGGAHRQGVLVQIDTKLHQDTRLLWQSRIVALKRMRGKTLQDPQQSSFATAIDTFPRDRYLLPADLGRRYARVAGDLNPIHQRPWLSRPFGFPRPIIHGMWTLAWATQPWLAEHPEQPQTVHAEFRRPIALPSTVQAHGQRDSDGQVQGEVRQSATGETAMRFMVATGTTHGKSKE